MGLLERFRSSGRAAAGGSADKADNSEQDALRLIDEGNVLEDQGRMEEAMQRAVDGFYGKIRPGMIGLIFFSGYGIQANRQSFLIPVDVDIFNESEVRPNGISLDNVLAEMNRKFGGNYLGDELARGRDDQRTRRRGTFSADMILEPSRDNPRPAAPPSGRQFQNLHHVTGFAERLRVGPGEYREHRVFADQHEPVFTDADQPG